MQARAAMGRGLADRSVERGRSVGDELKSRARDARSRDRSEERRGRLRLSRSESGLRTC